MLLDLPIGIRSTKYLHYSGDKHHNIRGHIYGAPAVCHYQEPRELFP